MSALSTTEYEVRTFETISQWQQFGPDLGNEDHPKIINLNPTYQQWLQANPQGFVCITE